jgi:geranylgeranyl reductase family protein
MSPVAPWDVAVVGAGPAGAAAALAACRARPGARVLLLDKAAFPRDKACGDGIAPHALDELAALGVPDAAAGHEPVARLRLRTPAGAEAAGAMVRPAHVVPRRVFDARLVAAAVAAGAVLVRARLRDLRQTPDHVQLSLTPGEAVAARVVVGADGANSVVRRALGVAGNPAAHLAVAVRGYAPAPATSPTAPPEQLIALVADGWPAYFWSFPIGDGRANVGYGLLRRDLRGGRDDLHGRLARLLPGQPAEPGSLRAAHLPLSTARPAVAHGRVLLAGDAASLVNPLTGEGIFYAVASGRRAGTAAVTAPGDPGRAYTRALRRLLGAHLRQTAVLGRAMRHRPLTEAAVRAAARSPRLFDDLVEVGLGAGRVRAAGAGRVVHSWVNALLVDGAARA